MASPSSRFPRVKTTGNNKYNMEVYIEDLIDYCMIKNWYEPAKETENTLQEGHTYSPVQRLMSWRLSDLFPMAMSQLQPQTASLSLIVHNIAGRK